MFTIYITFSKGINSFYFSLNVLYSIFICYIQLNTQNNALF